MDTRLTPIDTLEIGDWVLFNGTTAKVGWIGSLPGDWLEVELDADVGGTQCLHFKPEELIHQIL